MAQNPAASGWEVRFGSGGGVGDCDALPNGRESGFRVMSANRHIANQNDEQASHARSAAHVAHRLDAVLGRIDF